MKVFLETDRLLFRPFTRDDAENLFRLDSDPEVLRFIHSPPSTFADIVQQTLPRLLACHEKYHDFGYWATLEKRTNQFIGWLHFRPAADNRILFRPGIDGEDEVELGYRLMPAAWGKGYATEGSRALIQKGFTQLGVKKITATAMAENVASIRVMEKAGLKFAESYFHEGIGTEMVKYALERAHRSEG